jgi:hypothetical protein
MEGLCPLTVIKQFHVLWVSSFILTCHPQSHRMVGVQWGAVVISYLREETQPLRSEFAQGHWASKWAKSDTKSHCLPLPLAREASGLVTCWEAAVGLWLLSGPPLNVSPQAGDFPQLPFPPAQSTWIPACSLANPAKLWWKRSGEIVSHIGCSSQGQKGMTQMFYFFAVILHKTS